MLRNYNGMRKKYRERFINFRFTKKLVNHDIFPDHYHTNERKAQHDYLKCIEQNKNNENAMEKCKEDKKAVFEKEAQARKDFVKEYKKRGVHFCIENNLKAIQQNECLSDCKIAKKGFAEIKIIGYEGMKVSSTDSFLLNKACKKEKESCDNKYEKLYKCNNEKDENICKTNPVYLDQYISCKGGVKSDGINLDIKNSFFGNVLRKSSEGNPFQIIYYLFTLFAFLLFGGIIIWIIWWLFEYVNMLSGNKFALHFPGRIIWEPLSLYFTWIHKYLVLFSLICFIFLLGIVVLLYFIKKAFGWWLASWVWDATGIFKGSKPPFRWFDSFFGCIGFGSPLFCNSQAMWNLIEDWVVVTCKKNIKNCGNKSEDEIRSALNSFKSMFDRETGINTKTIEKNSANVNNDISDTIDVIETFQNNKKRKTFKSKKLIEEFFTFAEKLDNVDSFSETISESNDQRNEGLEDSKEKYDEEGDSGQKEKKTYEKAKEKEEQEEEDKED